MKTIRLAATIIWVSLSVLAYTRQTIQTGSATPDALERQVRNNEPYSTTLSSFLISLVTAHVPGGIVTIEHCDDRQASQPTLFTSGSLRDSLQEIVKTNPEYQWQLHDGVVNLLPTRDEPALLTVRINRLKMEDAPTIGAILGELFELPEVRDAIAKLQLSPGTKVVFGSGSPPREKYTVECRDVTVREALNAIVRAHGRAVWEYKEQRCDGKIVYTVNFIAK
jgi:hypothetical protein